MLSIYLPTMFAFVASGLPPLAPAALPPSSAAAEPEPSSEANSTAQPTPKTVGDSIAEQLVAQALSRRQSQLSQFSRKASSQTQVEEQPVCIDAKELLDIRWHTHDFQPHITSISPLPPQLACVLLCRTTRRLNLLRTTRRLNLLRTTRRLNRRPL